MKLIKAYVRPEKVGMIIDSLKKLKVSGISATDVKGIGQDLLSSQHKLSLELDNEASRIVKLEVICEESEKEKIISEILSEAYTGETGDGLISISKVDEIYHIRTGKKQLNHNARDRGEDINDK